MLFHYERELIGEGKIHKKYDGIVGVPLRNILNQPLPLGLSLLVYAGVADIITAAHGEGIVHGDLHVDDVYITKSGVIVDGFGKERASSRAPEGQSLGYTTDIYGLGIMFFVILSSNPDFYPIYEDEDSYNQNMIAAMINLTWAELLEQDWLDTIQNFFMSTISVHPQLRPEALDIANITHSIIPHCYNCDFVELSASLVVPEVQPQAEEILPVPQADTENLNGPNLLGDTGFDNLSLIPESSKGAATGLWSREAIANIYSNPEPDPELEIQEVKGFSLDENHSFPPEPEIDTEEIFEPIEGDLSNAQEIFPQSEHLPPPIRESIDGNLGFADASSIPKTDFINTPIKPSDTFGIPDIPVSHPDPPIAESPVPPIKENSDFVTWPPPDHDSGGLKTIPEPNAFPPDIPREPTVEERPTFDQPQKRSFLPIILGVLGLFGFSAAAALLIFNMEGDKDSQETTSTKVQTQTQKADSESETKENTSEPQVEDSSATQIEESSKTKTNPTQTKTRTNRTQTKTRTNRTQTKTDRTKTEVIAPQKDRKVMISVSSSSAQKAININCSDGQQKKFSQHTSMVFERDVKCTIDVNGVLKLFKIKKSGMVRCSDVQGEACVVR